MVVAAAGLVRDGYQALFRAIAGLSVMEPEEDLQSASTGFASEIPDLIVLDTGLISTDEGKNISVLKQSGFTGRCLAICSNASQEKKLRSSGIDNVVIDGIPPAELAAAIKQLAMDIRRKYN